MKNITTNNIYDAVNQILDEYNKNDVCIQELLNDITITGLNINDTVRVYAILSKILDNDTVVRYAEGDAFNLFEDEDLIQILSKND